MFRVILKDRGQVTIPSKVRKGLELKAGDVLEIEVRAGQIVLKPLQVVEREGGGQGVSSEWPEA